MTTTSRRDAAVPGGAVHELPANLRALLLADPATLEAWISLTELGRNEFICWATDAKQEATRERRVRQIPDRLAQGQRRPCCWPGCTHRGRGRQAG